MHAQDASHPFATASSPGRDAQPRGCTCARLRRLTRRVTAIYDRELAPAGLRVTQFSLLATLRHGAQAAAERAPGPEPVPPCDPGVPVSQLADLMEMDRTTLTRNLKPLAQQGWVELFTDAADRRIHRARITPAGLAAFATARPMWLTAQQLVNRTLGPSTVAALHDWIDLVTPSFRQGPGNVPQPEEAIE